MASLLPELAGLDEHIAMYAAVGMCVSEAAEIEWYMFECYFLASGLELEDAIHSFHRLIQFDHKRSITNKAMRSHLESEDLRAWEAVLAQVDAVCGRAGARNLVSHNPVRASVYASVVAHEIDRRVVVVPEIVQNAHLVRVKKREDRREDLSSLSEYIRALREASGSLMRFWIALAEANAARD